MLKLTDGKNELYQWDVNQRLEVNNSAITQVHFANALSTEALVCHVYGNNGKRYVDIPNILLQEHWDIRAFGCCVNCVRFEYVFNVVSRAKPADYVYTETDVIRYASLDTRLGFVEENYTTKVHVREAVADKATITYVDNAVKDKATTGYVDKAVSNVKVDLSGYATEKYVDDAIANVEISGGGGNVQADWNQNDSTKPDYIKNRICYAELETLLEGTAPIFEEDGMKGYEFESFANKIENEDDTYIVQVNDELYEDVSFTIVDDLPFMGSIVVFFMASYGFTREEAEIFVSQVLGYVDDSKYNFCLIMFGDEVMILNTVDMTEQCYLNISRGEVKKKISPMYIPELPYLEQSDIIGKSYSNVLAWDGNREGKVVVTNPLVPEADMCYVKVSDAIPTVAQLEKGTMTLYDSGTIKTGSILTETEPVEDKGDYIDAADGIILVAKQPLQLGEIYLPQAGTYFLYANVEFSGGIIEMYPLNITLEDAIFYTDAIKPSLIPQEVATKAYVDSAVKGNEKEWELIETITVSENGITNIVRDYKLNKLRAYIHTTPAASAYSMAAEIKNSGGMFGYSWIGNGINTADRYIYLEAVSDGDTAYVNCTAPSPTTYTAQMVNRTPTRFDGSTPINRFSIYVSGVGEFQIGTTIEIWGVKA